MANQLSLRRLLDSERVIVGLKAKRYDDAVAQLLDRLEAAGLINDRQAVDKLVDAELAGGKIPTLGGRALLAHYRTDAARELAVAIGTSKAAFPFAPAKVSEANFLILIVAPLAASRYYLKTLAAFSRLFREPKAADALTAAGSAAELLDLIARRDVVIRPELAVADLMSREVQSVTPETPLSETVHLMVRHRRRGVPVLSDNGEVLGIVTEREVLQHFLPQVLGSEEQQVEDIEVRDVMQRSVYCLSEDQLISDVLGAMITESVSQFPVVREGKLVGFLSRTDLIEKLLEHTV